MRSTWLEHASGGVVVFAIALAQSVGTQAPNREKPGTDWPMYRHCLLYTSDAADE